MKKTTLAPLALGLVLGALGAAFGHLALPLAHAAPAGPAAQKWEYNCFNKVGRAPGGRKVSDIANELGRAGWELAAAAGNGASDSDAEMIFCFKRPLGM